MTLEQSTRTLPGSPATGTSGKPEEKALRIRRDALRAQPATIRFLTAPKTEKQ
ncbi:MAG TPA: hypothetical protein VNN10_10325 [Dehalococcoidia bacterium]|nr:hypothetical protein [Dehalococcoidia bacterium]